MNRYLLLMVVVFGVGMGIYSCQKDNLITNVPHGLPTDLNWGKQAPDSLVAKYYFRGKIDSVLYTFQDSIGSYYNLAYDSGYIKCLDTNYVFYGQACGMYRVDGFMSLEIKLLKCVFDTSSQDGKDSLLYIGAYPYGSSRLSDPIAGVEITWVDDKGKIWKSLPGSGAKTNDSFVITSVIPAPTDTVGSLVISGTMDVRLYNLTESIRIEGGEFNLQYGVYK